MVAGSACEVQDSTRPLDEADKTGLNEVTLTIIGLASIVQIVVLRVFLKNSHRKRSLNSSFEFRAPHLQRALFVLSRWSILKGSTVPLRSDDRPPHIVRF